MLSYSEFVKKNCSFRSVARQEKLYRMYVESNIVSPDFNNITSVSTAQVCVNDFYSFAPFKQECPKKAPVPCQKQDGNKTMYVDNDKNLESHRISYLNSRVSELGYVKEQALRKTFNLDNDPAPETAEDFVARIQAGKFTLSDETKKKTVYDPARYITWRDPAVKADKDGFAVAVKVLESATQSARDVISQMDAIARLAALKEFEGWTYTPAA